jgi:hypothetical protein
MTTTDDIASEAEARTWGREAAEAFKRALAEGRPLTDVVELWPKRADDLRNAARDLVASDQSRKQKSGRWWLAYIDAFETEWPQHRNFI